MAYLIPIGLIAFLVLINGVYVAAEFAIASAPHTRVARMVESGSSAARRILVILRSPWLINRYISTAQVGITVATLGLGMYGEHTIAHWIEAPLEQIPGISEALVHTFALILAVALITYLHVVVGEMVPKSLALQKPVESAIALNGIMSISEKIFLPLTVVLNFIGDLILTMVGVPPAKASDRLVSSEELEYIVAESSEGGYLEPNERVFLENVLDFQERTVGQVMTPRTRVTGIPVDANYHDALGIVCVNRHSRYPLYDGDLDQIVGILHAKDLARYVVDSAGDEATIATNFEITELVRDAIFVPESLALEQMLAQFRQERSQIAVVVDEYGGTAGIITLEDLAEELVGEIQDESDEELAPFELLESGQVLARGDLLLDELNQHFELELENEHAETVGGLVMALLGHVAKQGEVVSYQRTTLKVEAVDGLAVRTVLVTLPEPTDE